jgi:hypothetical protein
MPDLPDPERDALAHWSSFGKPGSAPAGMTRPIAG